MVLLAILFNFFEIPVALFLTEAVYETEINVNIVECRHLGVWQLT